METGVCDAARKLWYQGTMRRSLLADIRAVTNKTETDRLATKEILEARIQLETLL
jgi:hypothetical protein